MPDTMHNDGDTLTMDRRRSSRIVLVGVFLGMVTRGLILPALPPFIIGNLGADIATVGVVMAVQSLASLITRPWAGRLTDRYGGRMTLTVGLGVVSLAALVYLLAEVLEPRLALAVLVVARILTGVGEGMIVTGGGTWAVALAGLERAGRAMTWIGLAMFGGVIVGAAGGSRLSFPEASGLVLIIAAISVLIVRRASAQVVAHARTVVPFRHVLGAVFWPGLTLGLAATGLVAVSSYVVLLFASRGWVDGGFAIALFSVGGVSARVLLGRYADSLAGRAAVMLSLGVEACGLAIIGAATTPHIAHVGTALAGFGFSMIYPWMALPALRGVSSERRGSVIGCYDAAFDIAAALAASACGLLAARWGVPAVFYVAAAVVLFANVAVLATNCHVAKR
jgi:MFS family permease